MKKELLLFFCFLIFAGKGFAQDEISLNIRNSTVQDVFSTLEKKTDYLFYYGEDLPDLDKEISFAFSNVPIDTILFELQAQTSLSFRFIDDRLITVIPQGIVFTPATIRGRVTSPSEPEGIIGVTVVVKGTTQGVITGLDGSYEIQVPDKYSVLQFSYIGLEAMDLPLNGKVVLDVEMNEGVHALEEVVVTALNLERNKSSLGYSISQVGADELNQAKENNPLNSLAGKVAGLQITKAPTGVDGSSRVILRGVTSLLGNNRPLFVIDGIPMDAGYGGGNRWGGQDSGDALADLNPEDIESMSVLKGAGAAAAYGSRGANGVIIVTTKKGTKRKGIGVSFSSSYSVETPMVTPEFQNDYAQGAFGNYPAGMNGSRQDHPWIWSYGPQMTGQTENDWTGMPTSLVAQPNPYETFFRKGTNFTNSLSLTGGNDVATFLASFTNQDSKGILPNNEISRQTINMRGTSKLSEKLRIDGKLTYIRSVGNNRPHLAESGLNMVQSLSVLPRSISLESLENNTVDAEGSEMKWSLDNTFSNPYWILENVGDEDEKHRLQAMFSVNWDIVENLDLMVRSGFDFSNRRNKSWENPGRPSIYSGQGSISQSMSNNTEWNTDMLLTYKIKWNDINMDLSAGGNYRYNEGVWMSQWGAVQRIPDFYNISNYSNYGTGEGSALKSVYSAYGLGTIYYKNFLYLDVTARNDWSSTLPLENNSYFYHSENLSFLFAKAFGWENKILTTGSLRASYAKVGNDTGPYQIDQYYYLQQTQTPWPMAGMGGQLPQFDLQPEETKSWEVGTNLVFLKNRLVLDATYYYSMSDKQIMNVALASSSGYSSKKMNAGEIQNTGWEIQLNATPVSTNWGLSWDVGITWWKNNSMVRKLYDDIEFLLLASEFHMTIEAHVDQPYGQIYFIDYERDAFGNKLIDKNGYATAGERKAMGDINPDWNAGITNTLTYKGLSLSFLIDMQMGGDIYSWGNSYRGLFGTSKDTEEGRTEWLAGTGGFVEEGINEETGRPNEVAVDPTYRWYNLFNKKIGTEWLIDATNVRMREVVLGYNLPVKWLTKTPLAGISLSVVGRNLFFIYKASEHFDPESGFSSGNTGTGIEHLSLPSTTSYGVNLRINF